MKPATTATKPMLPLLQSIESTRGSFRLSFKTLKTSCSSPLPPPTTQHRTLLSLPRLVRSSSIPLVFAHLLVKEEPPSSRSLPTQTLSEPNLTRLEWSSRIILKRATRSKRIRRNLHLIRPGPRRCLSSLPTNRATDPVRRKLLSIPPARLVLLTSRANPPLTTCRLSPEITLPLLVPTSSIALARRNTAAVVSKMKTPRRPLVTIPSSGLALSFLPRLLPNNASPVLFPSRRRRRRR